MINKTFSSASKRVFNHIQRKFLYYDNVKAERNLDFVFNLGYNKISSSIISNLSILTTSRFFTRQFLIWTMTKNYKELLLSIEKADTKKLEELLENRISRVLFKDLVKLAEKEYTVRIVNKGAPVFLKLVNFYEFTNVKLNRDQNEDVEGYELRYKGKNKLVFKNLKHQPAKILNKRTREEMDRERALFETSEEKKLCLDQLRNEAEFEFDLKYVGDKVKNNPSEANIQFYENLIKSLKEIEKETTVEAREYKKGFSDYFNEKEKFINNKVQNTDLYIYFKEKMPNNYSKLFKKTGKISFRKQLISALISLKDKFSLKFSNSSRKFSRNYNKLFVIDVEVASKMRIEIVDKEGNNVLEKDYNYTNAIKSSLSYILQENTDVTEYDTSLYKLRPSDHIWDIKHPEYMQRHMLRFEYERKSLVQWLLKNPLKKMKITDIDIALKGNKHFNFEKL